MTRFPDKPPKDRENHASKEKASEQDYTPRQQAIYKSFEDGTNKRLTQMSEQSVQEAEDRLFDLLENNETVKDLIVDFGDKQESPVELIRNNDELRLKLGTLFEDTLETISRDLPERVKRNDRNNLKNINYPGYDYRLPMTSHEYSSLLALSMLDGTFVQPTYDDTYLVEGEVVSGQHRHAAKLLLSHLTEQKE